MHLLEDLATVGFIALGLVLLARHDDPPNRPRIALLGITAAFAAFRAFDLVHIAAVSIRHPPLWDFRVFWMVAQVVAAHHNVYDPASYQIYRTVLNPTNDVEFNTVALKIGLPYPPPAILLLYPLGFVSKLATALTVWYVAIFGAITACIVMLRRHFFAAEGAAGWIVAASLVVALSATQITVGLAQLDFFALLLLLLFWNERTPWRAGLWLAALIVPRPLCILLAVYFVIRRQWNALTALIGTSVALLAVSIPIIGTNAFASYLHENPTARYPEIYFVGSQSLYKVLVQFSGHHAGYFSLRSHPLYDGIAVLCIFGTVVICALGAKRQRNACLGLLLSVALFLYPNTDTHYCSLLLVPLAAVWRDRRHLRLPANAVIAIISAQFLLLDLRAGATTTGLLLALDSVLFAFLALRRPQLSTAPPETPREPASSFASARL